MSALRDCCETLLVRLKQCWSYTWEKTSEFLYLVKYTLLCACPTSTSDAHLFETATDIPQQELFEQHKAVSMLTLSQQEQNERMLELRIKNELLQKQILEIKEKLEVLQQQTASNDVTVQPAEDVLSAELKARIEELARARLESEEKTAQNLEKLQQSLIAMIYQRNDQTLDMSDNVTFGFVKKIVDDAIRMYDADKTAATDYALESAGGQVRSIRCTESYVDSSKSYYFYGWHVYSTARNPSEAINPGMSPGQCWAFVGSLGYLLIELSHVVFVTGFTMEHVSKTLMPNGRIESAPKDFSLWGLDAETSNDPVLFGSYTYLDNGETLQYYPVQNRQPKPFKYAELKITSNHGHSDYTCLYRIRVHGHLASTSATT